MTGAYTQDQKRRIKNHTKAWREMARKINDVDYMEEEKED